MRAVYSYCEPDTAGSMSRWHIRRLTDAGRKLSGGADTAALCGRKVAWDIDNIDVTADTIDRVTACAACAARWGVGQNTLAAIRDRTDAATPAPWFRGAHIRLGQHGATAIFSSQDENAEPFMGLDPVTREDAEFIAHAREDVPLLLDVAEAARRVSQVAADLYVDSGASARWSVVRDELERVLAPLLEDQR